jgi:radical SAM protein with 4Fe4S-binding SPASM domain
VLCDGTVVPCCLDGNGVMALGNIFDTPLSEILSTPRATAIFEGFNRRIAVEELCKHCNYKERFNQKWQPKK